jgi:hypothetical protein
MSSSEKDREVWSDFAEQCALVDSMHRELAAVKAERDALRRHLDQTVEISKTVDDERAALKARIEGASKATCGYPSREYYLVPVEEVKGEE